ncbi:MAG TPA: hypothetical protein PLM07_14170 [Candidatus Rifleibacterium sp.]|nr:hypothetical protein [Candidatus Rifleibacterium sp.]HPT47030.1 hypothetical protein [Candidatus Rifleibacterium sp.]
MAKRTDYDSPWKDLVEKYFQQFMEFFFPEIAASIDWQKKYEFLDKEFQKIAVEGVTGRRYADKLVKVNELTGQEAWVLVHLEIQGQEDSDLARRMLVYHYRIFDRYQKRIASLALLADKNIKWRPQEYCHELWGCELSFRFPMVKLLDVASKVEDLENSQNPFAIAAFAHLKTIETIGNDSKRLEFKTYAARALYKAKFDRQTILELFRFLDWIMTLPADYENAYTETLNELEENMRYVTTFERRGIAKGIEKGIEKGLEEGIASHKASLNTILQLRFERIPARINSAIENINDLEALKNLVINAAVAESIEVFQDYLGSVVIPANKVSEPTAAYAPTRKPRTQKRP